MNNKLDKPLELLSFIHMKVHKNRTEAEKFARKALALDSSNIFAHYLVAKNMVGSSTQKIQSLNLVKELENKYLAASFGMGHLYFQIKQYINAAYCFEKCIDIPQETPNHPINRLRQFLVELGLLSKSEKIMLSSESFPNDKNRIRFLFEQQRLPKGGNKVSMQQPNKSEKKTREQLIDPQKREKMRQEEDFMDSIYRLDHFMLGIQQQEEQYREKTERKKKEENKRAHSNYLYENQQIGMKSPEKKQERRPLSRSTHHPSLQNKSESVKRLKPQPARKEEKKLYWI